MATAAGYFLFFFLVHSLLLVSVGSLTMRQSCLADLIAFWSNENIVCLILVLIAVFLHASMETMFLSNIYK